MSKLDDARIIINDIDKKMIELFKERMKAVEMVASYKIENNLPVLDSKREELIIEKNIKLLNDNNLEKYYLTFFNGVLASSRCYQEDVIKGDIK